MQYLRRQFTRRLDPATRGWAVTTAGGGARLALGFVASVLLARALGPAGFGLFAVLGAVANVVGAGADFGINDAAVKRVAGTWPADPARAAARGRAFVWLRAGAAMLVAGAGSLLAVALALLSQIGPDLGRLLPLALLGMAATALSGAVGALLQATGRFGRLALVALANAGLTAALAVLLTLTGHLTLVTALLGLGAATSLAGFAVGRRFLPAGWRLGFPGRAALAAEWRVLFAFGRWLWVANVCAMLAAQLDVLLLDRWRDAATVGAYALALNLASKADIVNSSLYTVLLPAAASLSGAGAVRRYVRRSLARSTLIALALLPAIPLAGVLIPLVYGPGYSPAVGLFRGLLAIVIFDVFATPLLLLVYHYERPRLLAGADALRALTVALAGVALIPALGAPGAILARLAGRVAGAALTGVGLRTKD
ncbi:MAG TPA: lipopolysaccharide biosynthesis protein [Thermomicrobiales bacterium]|nr:lipopolysaccharide biosynthesis protein [Thermomicrobiales bacterium]